MLIFVMSFATVLAVCWLVLLCMAAREDWLVAAYNKVLDNQLQIRKLRLKDAARSDQLAKDHSPLAPLNRLLAGKGNKKEIDRLLLQNEQLQGGNLKKVFILDIPGYVLLRLIPGVNRSEFRKSIWTKCVELYGKKHADNKTRQLIARLLSYSSIGLAVSLSIGSIIMGTGNTSIGVAVLTVGTLLVLVLVYALYDEVSDQINKRRDAISRQFPGVVSKLALLVTSGMIMDRAWKETAYSQSAELYLEMQRTSEELENLVSPEAAYGDFINRCNTKETSKLASAIMQNLSKGNAEIGALLKSMAKDAWLDRRLTAKKDSEKANSMLMIPTMMLFIAILIMIMVPIAINFSAL